MSGPARGVSTPRFWTVSMKEAEPDELEFSLTFALRFEGRKRTHQADEAMARIAARRIMEHLQISGYVVMKKPLAPPNSASAS